MCRGLNSLNKEVSKQEFLLDFFSKTKILRADADLLS